jgi:hypothetical protein
MVAILTEVRWNCSVILIVIFFMARDGEHFVMCFLAIWTSSFEKVLFSSVAHFFIGALIFWEFNFIILISGETVSNVCKMDLELLEYFQGVKEIAQNR